MTEPDLQPFADEAAACGDAFDMTIVRPATLQALARVALDPTRPEAERVWAARTRAAAFSAVERVFADICADGAAICASCEQRIEKVPMAFAVVTADVRDPTHIVTAGLCDECAPEHPTEAPAKQAAAVVMEKHLRGSAVILDNAVHRA